MSLIIDGYNLIHADEGLSAFLRANDLEKARDVLIALLTRYSEKKQEKITVVFDGVSGKGPRKQSKLSVTIWYSSGQKNADDVIEELLMAAVHPSSVTVVTSDREVRKTAESYGARSVDSLTFSREMRRFERPARRKKALEPPEKHGKPISQDEIDYWSGIFRDEEYKDATDET